ncbi:MAG: hypothetical protein ACK2UO_12440 [Caldilineaceae bacterium]|jgi:hypothetical protein
MSHSSALRTGRLRQSGLGAARRAFAGMVGALNNLLNEVCYDGC